MSGPTVLPVTPLASAPSKFWPTFLLALFLGGFGAHRFYNNSPKKVLMLLTLGGLGIWTLIDCIVILLGKFKDRNGTYIANPKPVVSWAIFGVCVLIGMSNNSEGGFSISGGGKYETVNGVTQTSDSHDDEIHVRYVITGRRAVSAARSILELQYSMSKRHPNAKTITVHTYIDKGQLDLVDEYGNKATGLTEIGPFSTDAVEARKYADADAFGQYSEPMIVSSIVSMRRSWFIDSNRSPF